MTRLFSQEAILQAMADPRIYPHHPERVEVIHTHISAVFIAPPRVYKIKKPKDYGFLNFTTLESRRYYCRREIALNRRLAPDVYIGVGSLVEQAGELRLVEEDRDDALEYCVIMQYLQPEGVLKNLLSHESPQRIRELMEFVVSKLVEFYRENPLPPDLASWGEPETIFGNVVENFEQMEPLFPQGINRSWLTLNRFFAEQFFRTFRSAFTSRKKYMVEAHGDLHTWHLYFEITPKGTKLSILDGIEFNERFRCLDLMADVAFLVMDLEAEGYGELARWFAERFITSLPKDPTHRGILPFYLAYRAMVRAKVNLLTLQSPEVPEHVKAEALENLKRYLALALRYSLKGLEPTLFCFCGPSGGGKSTLAQNLSDLLSCERLSSDRIRKALAGIPPLASSGSPPHGGIYTPEMSQRTYATLEASGLSQAASIGVAVLDATYLEREQRLRLSQSAREAKIRLVWIALDEDGKILEERVKSRRASESEATVEILRHQLEKWMIPVEVEEGQEVLYLPATTSPVFLGHALVFAHLRRLFPLLSSSC